MKQPIDEILIELIQPGSENLGSMVEVLFHQPGLHKNSPWLGY